MHIAGQHAIVAEGDNQGDAVNQRQQRHGEQADASRPGASLLPVVRDLRASSAMLAEAVVRATVADGVAVFSPTNPAQVIQDAMWRPGYPDIRSVPARR